MIMKMQMNLTEDQIKDKIFRENFHSIAAYIGLIVMGGLLFLVCAYSFYKFICLRRAQNKGYGYELREALLPETSRPLGRARTAPTESIELSSMRKIPSSENLPGSGSGGLRGGQGQTRSISISKAFSHSDSYYNFNNSRYCQRDQMAFSTNKDLLELESSEESDEKYEFEALPKPDQNIKIDIDGDDQQDHKPKDYMESLI